VTEDGAGGRFATILNSEKRHFLIDLLCQDKSGAGIKNYVLMLGLPGLCASEPDSFLTK